MNKAAKEYLAASAVASAAEWDAARAAAIAAQVAVFKKIVKNPFK